MFTPDRELRDYLLTELSDGGHLLDEEVEMMKFVHKLESLYSCPSFDVAKLLRTEALEQNRSEETGNFPFTCFVVPLSFSEERCSVRARYSNISGNLRTW